MTKILQSFSSGYLLLGTEDRLFFTEDARAVLGSIIGFISGLWLTGKHEMANSYADDFLKWMDYVCPVHTADLYQPDCYGSRNRKVPSRICEFKADGTVMGFSLAWYVLLADQQQPTNGRECRKFGIWDAKYTYQMNGGLLFHGSNQEDYSVSLGNSLWSIHT